MSADQEFEPNILLEQITAATEQFLDSAAGLSDADVREPSLLPDWTRGHVLSHLARNADGGSRLLTWARSGVETPEYPSMAARAEEIEAGAGRSAGDLLDDVRVSAARFAYLYGRMPVEAWQNLVRWTGGQQHPAARIADSRLDEVLVHHVDLRTAYTPADWPAPFTRNMLRKAVGALSGRTDTPAMRLHATDTDAWYDIGTSPAPLMIDGTQSALLGWLMGRSTGADLSTPGDAELPTPPFLY
jgi:maleylpyruvate isomerase